MKKINLKSALISTNRAHKIHRNCWFNNNLREYVTIITCKKNHKIYKFAQHVESTIIFIIPRSILFRVGKRSGKSIIISNKKFGHSFFLWIKLIPFITYPQIKNTSYTEQWTKWESKINICNKNLQYKGRGLN